MRFWFSRRQFTNLWRRFKVLQKHMPRYLLGKKRQHNPPKSPLPYSVEEERGMPLFPKFGVTSPISDTSVRHKVAEIGKRLAEEYERRIKNLIYLQQGEWVPLTAAYLNYKIKNKLDPRILIATGTYVGLIQVRQIRQDLWVVDIPPVPLPNGSGYTYRDLARWLEYGTEKMPPRPHWRLVARQMANRPKELAKLYSIELEQIESEYLKILSEALGVT